MSVFGGFVFKSFIRFCGCSLSQSFTPLTIRETEKHIPCTKNTKIIPPPQKDKQFESQHPTKQNKVKKKKATKII